MLQEYQNMYTDLESYFSADFKSVNKHLKQNCTSSVSMETFGVCFLFFSSKTAVGHPRTGLKISIL